MDFPRLDPQMRAALARNDEIVRELGPPTPGIEGVRAQAAAARAWWNEGGPAMAQVRDGKVPGPHREIPVRVYVPRRSASPLPACVFFHGGGWRIGSPASNDRQLRELAEAWGGIVVSADYAHMPEKTFPAPVEEAAAVYGWLARHGCQWGIDGQRLAFGGNSAGANVAMGAFHAAAQVQGAFRCAAFVVGVFDGDVETQSMREYGDAGLFPTRESARKTFEDYLGNDANLADPRFNALQADSGRLPPVFLAAAECDVYRDSSAALARRIREAGRSAELRVYPGMTHLFFGYSRMVDRAAECIGDVARFLREHLPPAND
ncbi:hypothetical protein EZ313_19215 [Ramlibacter henchirensis]|uniref:Alpha/beta hydrolase fold-3 domain-containing protein n=1 Tax=Ramlibacter henchirensis TaxID=204072 RepID=A0A4Z0BQS6_9BURK|nr:alpha/beta hydrolase fold domain-containing protein [Ramlibacter henchirensis]TFZ00588.1 hypothetical protein EZ313_19215 [Ramlibacter henchirensis]